MALRDPLAAVSSAKKRPPPHDLLLLLLSIALQLVLGVLFGHIYDMRVFMAAGYEVAAGHNPYLARELSLVFHNAAFQGITTVGYPPPWPLLLGAIYRLVYATLPNFLAYNGAIKLPLIMANVVLAHLAAACLRRLGASEVQAHGSWVFLLFNPFLLYASAAWGQFDSIVAVLSLAALMLLDSQKIKSSAVLLALAISFKPTAFPLVLVPFFFLGTKRLRPLLTYYALLPLSGFVFCVVPFLIFRWDPSPILQNWNAHFVVGGGLTPMATLEIVQNSYRLAGNWWLLGLLWIPALAITSVALRPRIYGFRNLLRAATAVIMVFFLTRAWLSEPNIILVLPLVLILTRAGDLDPLWLHAVWILPLVFGIVNASTAQLFFPSMPHIMESLLQRLEEFRMARLIAKVIVVVPWQVVGWSIVVRCLRRPPAALTDQPA